MAYGNVYRFINNETETWREITCNLLYFLGIEVNDKLRYEQIPQYSWTFLIIGTLFTISSIVIYIRSRKVTAL